jgi:hypothetical protein
MGSGDPADETVQAQAAKLVGQRPLIGRGRTANTLFFTRRPYRAARPIKSTTCHSREPRPSFWAEVLRASSGLAG